MSAAGKLFRQHGINGVGVADIGKAAGLTHGAVYARFPSKQALAAEALAEGTRQIVERHAVVRHEPHNRRLSRLLAIETLAR